MNKNLIVVLSLLFCINFSLQAGLPPFAFEEGQITVRSDQWLTVNLNNTNFINPVIVPTVICDDSSKSVVARLRNVTSTSFQIKLVPGEVANDVLSHPVTYICVETGHFDVAKDGIDLKAYKVMSTKVDHPQSIVGDVIRQKDAIVGKIIRVDCPGPDLSLAEVQVFDSEGVNVALGGNATQIHTGWGGVPSRAIDGNTSGNWGHIDHFIKSATQQRKKMPFTSDSSFEISRSFFRANFFNSSLVLA